MKKSELKDLVKKYFNLTENNQETLVEPNSENISANFATANLADGTPITNMVEGDFEVGQVLHVVTDEGEHVIAPSGEHTTESGIVITVDGEGIITGVKYPDQTGEGSLEEATEEEVEMSAETEEVTEETTEDKTEMAEHDDETQMDENDTREEIVQAIAEVVMPEIEAMKAKMAEHEEKLEEHEEKMNQHYSSTPASESKTATNSFSKTKININNNEGPKHNRKRYEMALARLTNKNQ
jgi:hypothetical protein